MGAWALDMSAAAVNHLIEGYGDDCGLVSLSIYLGLNYPDVVRAATVADRKQGRAGLGRRTIIRIAASLSHRLVLRRTFDPDEDYGIIVISDHAAVLRNGLVFDRQYVWDFSSWLAHHKETMTECQLLVVKE